MGTDQAVSREFRETITALCAREGLSPSADQISALDIHRKLLFAWGSRMNLTAIRDPGEIARRHFLEGILAGEILRRHSAASPLLDLGTGNGFPAVTIATIAERLRPIILVDSSARKAAFLKALLRELHWGDARVVVRRVESSRDLLDLPCLTFTLRGVRPFRFLQEGLPFLKPDGLCLVFMLRSALEKGAPAALSQLTIEDEVELEGREAGIILLRKAR